VDPILLFGTMVFWIIIVGIIGGVVLLRPVSKRLGHFLDEWIAIRKAELAGSDERLEELAARFAALEDGQHRLLEHQEFMDELKGKE